MTTQIKPTAKKRGLSKMSLIFLIVIFYILLGIFIAGPFDSHPVTMFLGFAMGMIATMVLYEQPTAKRGGE